MNHPEASFGLPLGISESQSHLFHVRHQTDSIFTAAFAARRLYPDDRDAAGWIYYMLVCSDWISDRRALRRALWVSDVETLQLLRILAYQQLKDVDEVIALMPETEGDRQALRTKGSAEVIRQPQQAVTLLELEATRLKDGEKFNLRIHDTLN